MNENTDLKEIKYAAKLSTHHVNMAAVATEGNAQGFKRLTVYTREGDEPKVHKLEGDDELGARMFMELVELPVDPDRDVYRIEFGASGIAVKNEPQSFGRLIAVTQDPSVVTEPDRNMPTAVAGALFGIEAEPDEGVELSEDVQRKAALFAVQTAMRHPMAGDAVKAAIAAEGRKAAAERGITDESIMGVIEGDEYVALASMEFGEQRTGISVGQPGEEYSTLTVSAQRTVYFEPGTPPVYEAMPDEDREQISADTEGNFKPVGTFSGNVIVREPGSPIHNNWLAGKIHLLVTDETLPPVKGAWVPKETADKMGFKGVGYRKGKPDEQAKIEALSLV